MVHFSGMNNRPDRVRPDALLKLSEWVHYVRMDEQVIVADMRSGHYLGLADVGARVWDLVGEGATPDGIIERISAEYDVSMDVVEQDVDRLLRELLARRLIDFESPRGQRTRS